MDSTSPTFDTRPPENNPALSAGLEAGLVGAVLILIEQLLQNFIANLTVGLILGLLRVCIWIGVGALAVYWLKGKGSVLRSDQTKAGLIAGLLTALVTAILLVIFGYLHSRTIDQIPIPEGIPPEMFDEFLNVFDQYMSLAIGISLFCCSGIPTLILGTAFSFGGSVIMRTFMGSSTQAPTEEQISFQRHPSKPISDQELEQLEMPPQRLQDFLKVEGLPLELHTSVAAFKRGELANARPAFVRFLRENPKQAYAWLWLSVMIDDPDRQLECIQRALVLEPGNETAQKMLDFLKKPPNI